jgi:lipid-A-disaccharide synthase
MVLQGTNPLIYLVAGEASGDLLGGRLMAALKVQAPSCHFAGVGGQTMETEGLSSLFPMDELSVMGLVEILPHAKRLLRRIEEVAQDVERQKPHVVVTIDAPGFNFRLAKKLKARGLQIPLVHYTAPTVWAWRPGRAKKIAGLFDHLLTLFPCEPPYFTPHGLKTTFVGHPLIEDTRLKENKEDLFRTRFNLAHRAPLVCCLLGSRRREIETLLPVFKETLEGLKREKPDLRVVCPVLPAYRSLVQDALQDLDPLVIDDQNLKYQAFQAANAALAASGTVSLELALAGTPMVIAYRVNKVTAFLMKRLLLTRFVCLVNILLQEEVVPECVQDKCTPSILVPLLKDLLTGKTRQKDKLTLIRRALTAPEGMPSDLAAKTILSFLDS